MERIRPDKTYLQETTWEEKAQVNPLYAVMSVDEFAASRSEPTDEELRRFFADGEEKVRRWIYPWMLETRVSAEMKLLEFGCGMGRLLRALGQYHPAERTYGIDISETMIAHARRHLAELVNLATVGQGGDFPFPDAHFDRVFSYAVFQHIGQKSVVQKSIREVARVLKRGGRVKLSFEMVDRPRIRGGGLTSDSHAFRDRSIIYGWSRKYAVPFWRIRVRKSNNWSGIRLGYQQLVKEFARNGITIYGLKTEFPVEKFVWFYGVKER